MSECAEGLPGPGLAGEAELAAALTLFRALAHEARLRILLALSRRGPMSAGALGEVCAMEQSAASHQLRILRQARLVTAERSGKQMIYTLHDRHVAHIIEDAVSHAAE